jgi:hypothetical protein
VVSAGSLAACGGSKRGVLDEMRTKLGETDGAGGNAGNFSHVDRRQTSLRYKCTFEKLARGVLTGSHELAVELPPPAGKPRVDEI